MVNAALSPEYGPVVAITVPQANTTVEPEMQALMSAGYSLLAARMTSPFQDSRARLVDYFDTLAQTLDRFDVAPVQAAGFACTGSSYLVGRQEDQRRLAVLSAGRGYPVLGTADAIARALQNLGARRIALLSPYPAWLSAAGQDYWGECGLELLSVASLPEDLLDTRNIYKLRTAKVREIFDQLELRRCDAVLLSGTGMPTLRLIAQLSLPVPVLSSNLCLAWALQCAVHAPKSESDVLAALLDVEAPWRGCL